MNLKQQQLFEAEPQLTAPLSRMYDTSVYRATPERKPRWTKISKPVAGAFCEECAALQHETRGAFGPRSQPRHRRAFPARGSGGGCCPAAVFAARTSMAGPRQKGCGRVKFAHLPRHRWSDWAPDSSAVESSRGPLGWMDDLMPLPVHRDCGCGKREEVWITDPAVVAKVLAAWRIAARVPADAVQ